MKNQILYKAIIFRVYSYNSTYFPVVAVLHQLKGMQQYSGFHSSQNSKHHTMPFLSPDPKLGLQIHPCLLYMTKPIHSRHKLTKKVMLTFAKNTHRETPEKNLVKTAATYTQRAQKILFYSEAL